eukprot:2122814-Prymnesium_polylepis.2
MCARALDAAPTSTTRRHGHAQLETNPPSYKDCPSHHQKEESRYQLSMSSRPNLHVPRAVSSPSP